MCIRIVPALACTFQCHSYNPCLPVAGGSSAKPPAVTRGTDKADSEELTALTKQIASLEKREARYYSCTFSFSIVDQ